ncbi:MAG: hypothetical protein R2794_11385 [Chitinophagales bacterium]
MGKIIAIANQKRSREDHLRHQPGCQPGGVEFKTLLVDADPQANSTNGVGFDPKKTVSISMIV